MSLDDCACSPSESRFLHHIHKMQKKGQIMGVIAILFLLIVLSLILVVFKDSFIEIYQNVTYMPTQIYKVDSITDGDTYTINGEKYRVLCMDFPDLDSTRIEKWLNMGISQEHIEKCYSDGINELKSMILNQDVTLSYDEGNKIDKYGRNLAYVYLGTTDIGLWLIQNGYAIQEYSPCSKELEYQIYEAKARLDQTGCLWQTTQ